MKKKYGNINEEVKRMKSLFSDNRMFGNLVDGSLTESTDAPINEQSRLFKLLGKSLSAAKKSGISDEMIKGFQKSPRNLDDVGKHIDEYGDVWGYIIPETHDMKVVRDIVSEAKETGVDFDMFGKVPDSNMKLFELIPVEGNLRYNILENWRKQIGDDKFYKKLGEVSGDVRKSDVLPDRAVDDTVKSLSSGGANKKISTSLKEFGDMIDVQIAKGNDVILEVPGGKMTIVSNKTKKELVAESAEYVNDVVSNKGNKGKYSVFSYLPFGKFWTNLFSKSFITRNLLILNPKNVSKQMQSGWMKGLNIGAPAVIATVLGRAGILGFLYYKGCKKVTGSGEFNLPYYCNPAYLLKGVMSAGEAVVDEVKEGVGSMTCGYVLDESGKTCPQIQKEFKDQLESMKPESYCDDIVGKDEDEFRDFIKKEYQNNLDVVLKENDINSEYLAELFNMWTDEETMNKFADDCLGACGYKELIETLEEDSDLNGVEVQIAQPESGETTVDGGDYEVGDI